MRVLTALVLVLVLSAPAFAQTQEAPKVDSAGVCHGPDGKPAKASVCAKGRKKRAPVVDNSRFFAHCRDVRSHLFTKCGGPYAEPVPSN